MTAPHRLPGPAGHPDEAMLINSAADPAFPAHRAALISAGRRFAGARP